MPIHALFRSLTSPPTRRRPTRRRPPVFATLPRIPGRPLPAQLQPGRHLPGRRRSAGGRDGRLQRRRPAGPRGRQCLEQLREQTWTLLRWRLREHRGGEQKECCEKTFHKRPSFRLTPTGASSVLGSARLWRVGDRILRSRTFAELRSLPRSFESNESSSPQNAATSTLKACAPQNAAFTLSGVWDFADRLAARVER